MDIQEFKTVLNRIVDSHSSFESIEDLDEGESLTIDCDSRGSLPLTIEKRESALVIARYTSQEKGNARLKFIFENPYNLQPVYMEDPFTSVHEQEKIKDFLCSTWKDVIEEDYLY